MKKKTSKQILTYLSATGLPPQDCRSVHNQMLKADPPYIRCHSDTTKHEKTKNSSTAQRLYSQKEPIMIVPKS